MTLSALAYRDFRWFLCGSAFTMNGIWMQRIAVGWLAWESTDSSAFVGLLGFLTFAPMIALGPFLGALSDRMTPHLVARLSQLAFAILSGLMLALLLLDMLSPLLLAALTLLLGTANAAYNPTRLPMAMALVAPNELRAVVSLSSFTLNLARMTGPAIGGLIIAKWGIAAAFAVQFLLYLPHLGVLRLIRPRSSGAREDRVRSLIDDVEEAVALAFRTPEIRAALLLSGIYGAVVRGMLEILPVIADGIHERGASGLGLLASMAGGGAMAGGLVQSLLPPRAILRRITDDALSGCLLSMALVACLGFVQLWPLTVSLIVAAGFLSSTTAISLVTGINLAIEDGMRGRMNSIWLMIAFGGAAFGALGLGLAIELLGAPTAFLAAGLAGFGLCLASRPR